MKHRKLNRWDMIGPAGILLAAVLTWLAVAPPVDAASYISGLRDHSHTASGDGGAEVAPAILGALDASGDYYISNGQTFLLDTGCTYGTNCQYTMVFAGDTGANQLMTLQSSDGSFARIVGNYHGDPIQLVAETAGGSTMVAVDCEPDDSTITNMWGQCTANNGDEYFETGHSESLQADYAITNNDTTYETVLDFPLPIGLYKYEFFGAFTANNGTPGMDLSVNTTGGTVDFEYGRLECIDNTTGVVFLQMYPNQVGQTSLSNFPDVYCTGMGTVEVSGATTIRLQMRQATTSANAIQAQEGVTLRATRVSEVQ